MCEERYRERGERERLQKNYGCSFRCLELTRIKFTENIKVFEKAYCQNCYQTDLKENEAAGDVSTFLGPYLSSGRMPTGELLATKKDTFPNEHFISGPG